MKRAFQHLKKIYWICGQNVSIYRKPNSYKTISTLVKEKSFFDDNFVIGEHSFTVSQFKKNKNFEYEFRTKY